MNTVSDQPVFEFAGFRLDTAQRRLYGPDGQPIPLAARAFDTLLYLLEHPGALLDKDRLMQAVWPNVIVAENNLNQAITQLRRALGEGHIVTIAGRGYQFVTPVTRLTTAASPEAVLDSDFGEPVQGAGETPPPVTQPEQASTHPRPNKSTAALYGLVVVLVALAAAYLYFNQHEILVGPINNQEQAVTFSAPVIPDKSVTVVGAPLQSVAVLAFADMSPDKDQEYFADGVSEEVLNQLSMIQDLFVVGRTSSFSFKDRNEDLRVIGDKLGVSHLLEGSVRKEGNRVRVSAQLVKAADGYHLWSQTYDRTLEDIFAVQEDISTGVAQALQVSLGLGEFTRLGWTRNVTAYEEYLRGRSDYLKASPQSLPKAVEHYQRAIDIDPAFILARTSLVETFC